MKLPEIATVGAKMLPNEIRPMLKLRQIVGAVNAAVMRGTLSAAGEKGPCPAPCDHAGSNLSEAVRGENKQQVRLPRPTSAWAAHNDQRQPCLQQGNRGNSFHKAAPIRGE